VRERLVKPAGQLADNLMEFLLRGAYRAAGLIGDLFILILSRREKDDDQ
jgi:hypothetical protein